jgi:Transglycosylase SLT domain
MIVEASGPNSTVTGAIRQASRMTGADFKYLLATAQVESNLNPNAKVSTSSASGLFQFIDQTWLGTLKEKGPGLGYASHAEAITRLPSGRYAITDPRMQSAVMNLRFDPAANALMAGAFTRANAEALADRLGRQPTEGELYIAHFLGSGGASRLIELSESNPHTPAATIFPAAASANSSIFRDRAGRARGAKEVYQVLVGRYDAARGAPATDPASRLARKIESQVAAVVSQIAGQVASPVAIKGATESAFHAASQAATQVKARIASLFAVASDAKDAADARTANDAGPRVAGAVETRVLKPIGTRPANIAEIRVANKVEQPARVVVRAAPAPDPVLLASSHLVPADKSPHVTPNSHVASVFHGLFRTGAETEPVAPLVSALWTSPGYASMTETAAPGRRAPAANRAASPGPTGEVHDFQSRFRGGG